MPTRYIILLTLIAALLAACTADSPPEPTPQTGPGIIEPTAVPLTTPQAPAGVGSIAIRNATELDFCGVYVSLTTAPDWGGNQLEEGRRIAAGEELIIEDIPFGTYDLRTEDCAVQTVDVEFAVTIDGDKAWTIEQAAVRIENDTDFTLCGVYARTTDAPGVGWGNNRLPAGDLEPGAEVNIPLAQTTWDLRATACDPDITPTEQLATELEGIIIWSPEFEE